MQDDDVKYKVRIYGVNESIQSSNKIERNVFDNEEINKITPHCGLGKLPIRDSFRMGRYDTKSTRPHPILVHFQSVWDVRKLFSSLSKLKSYTGKIFIAAALSSADRVVEKPLLKRRYDLIATGVSKSDIKIKNLRLFVKNEQVEISST